MLIWQRKLLDSCLKVGTMTCERTQHCPHNSLTMRAVLLGYARKLHFFFQRETQDEQKCQSRRIIRVKCSGENGAANGSCQ